MIEKSEVPSVNITAAHATTVIQPAMRPPLRRGAFDSPDDFPLRVSAVVRIQDRTGAEDVCSLYILYYRPKSK